MSKFYSEAPDVQEIADKLIEEIHNGLKEARVKCIFTSKETKRKGKVVMATARKVTGLSAYLAEKEEEEFELTGDPETDEFFCIIVDVHVWYGLTDPQKLALVDHELCHCNIKEKTTKHGDVELKLSIVPHDLEEFNDVVRRHGLWQEDVELFLKASQGKRAPETAEIIQMPASSTSSDVEIDQSFFNEVLAYTSTQEGVSTSMLQRRFSIGFQRASRLIDMMEEWGVIGQRDGPRPRKVLVTTDQLKEIVDAAIEMGPTLNQIFEDGSKIGAVTVSSIAFKYKIPLPSAEKLIGHMDKLNMLTKPDGFNNRYIIPKPKPKKKEG